MKLKVTFRWVAALLIILFLIGMSGCSTLAGLATNAVTGAVAKDEPLLGIDTEITAGDKTEGVQIVDAPVTKWDEVDLEDNAQLHNTSTGTLNDIREVETVTLNEGVKFWQAALAGVVLFLFGVFMPQLTVNRKKVN